MVKAKIKSTSLKNDTYRGNKMAKATPRSKCLLAIQLLSRVAGADDEGYCTCASCGDQFYYKDGDGGHFIAKGHSSYWSLEVENVHPQCKGCNGFGMKFGTASQQYTIFMIDMYGKEFVDNMIATKKTPIKMYKADYVDMLKGFNELIKYHKERIGE
jgi:hypothetical protein